MSRQSKIDSIVRLIEHPGTPWREKEAAEAAYYRLTKTAYVPNRPTPDQPQKQSFWSRPARRQAAPPPEPKKAQRSETPWSDSVRKAREEAQRRNHAHEYQSTGQQYSSGSGGGGSWGQSESWADGVSYDAQSVYESE